MHHPDEDLRRSDDVARGADPELPSPLGINCLTALPPSGDRTTPRETHGGRTRWAEAWEEKTCEARRSIFLFSGMGFVESFDTIAYDHP